MSPKRVCYRCGKEQCEGDIFVAGHWHLFCSHECVEEYEMGLKGWVKLSKVQDLIKPIEKAICVKCKKVAVLPRSASECFKCEVRIQFEKVETI